MMRTRMTNDDKVLYVQMSDDNDLAEAMLYKARNIKTKAEPQLFHAVYAMIKRLQSNVPKHGYWKTDDCDIQCSVCKEVFTFEVSMRECDPIEDLQMFHCPYCGSKMDEVRR